MSDSICYRFRHFVDDPEAIERELPGITALGSAYGSVRGNAGICRAPNRFMEPLPGGDPCPSFAVKPRSSPGQSRGRRGERVHRPTRLIGY